MSLGGSLKATIEYSMGTLGGAVYAGAIAALVPHYDEISLLAVLALAVAPLALLAAVNPHFSRRAVHGRHCGSRGEGADPGPLLGTLLRLRHDLVMIGRAAAVPLPERIAITLCHSSHAPIDNLIKTFKMFQMLQYKRNQIEEAISGVLEPRSQKPTAEMRTRLKRLLETDRALGRVPRSINPERANYAFYSAEAPGSGVEVWFSEYEAFALLNGLRLMAHGWTQGFAASVMRRVRPELERQHARILKQDAKPLFDQEAIRRNAKAGDMAFDNTDPVLLTIVSTSGVAPNEQGEPHRCAICRGPQEAMKFAWEASTGAGAWTMFELATVAHKFSNALGRTEPRHRGRG